MTTVNQLSMITFVAAICFARGIRLLGIETFSLRWMAVNAVWFLFVVLVILG